MDFSHVFYILSDYLWSQEKKKKNYIIYPDELYQYTKKTLE